MRIEELVPAEPGWKAVFREPDGGETVSRILGWAAVADEDEHERVGVIVDPAEPSRIVAAPDAASPDGGSFLRYRYIAPAPPPPPPAPAPARADAEEEPSTEDQAKQLAKSFIKKRR